MEQDRAAFDIQVAVCKLTVVAISYTTWLAMYSALRDVIQRACS